MLSLLTFREGDTFEDDDATCCSVRNDDDDLANLSLGRNIRPEESSAGGLIYA